MNWVRSDAELSDLTMSQLKRHNKKGYAILLGLDSALYFAFIFVCATLLWNLPSGEAQKTGWGVVAVAALSILIPTIGIGLTIYERKSCELTPYDSQMLKIAKYLHFWLRGGRYNKYFP